MNITYQKVQEKPKIPYKKYLEDEFDIMQKKYSTITGIWLLRNGRMFFPHFVFSEVQRQLFPLQVFELKVISKGKKNQ
jgi:hypothetical protein